MDSSTERAGKTLDPDAEKNVKAAIERIVEELGGDERGVDVKLARVLGFWQQHVHRIRHQDGRIGMDLARAVAKYFAIQTYTLLDYGPPHPVLRHVLRANPKRWSPEIVSYVIALTRDVDVDELYDWQWEEMLNELEKAHKERLKKLRRA